MVVMTFPVSETLKGRLAKMAYREGHTTSEWLRLKLAEFARRHDAAIQKL